MPPASNDAACIISEWKQTVEVDFKMAKIMAGMGFLFLPGHKIPHEVMVDFEYRRAIGFAIKGHLDSLDPSAPNEIKERLLRLLDRAALAHIKAAKLAVQILRDNSE